MSDIKVTPVIQDSNTFLGSNDKPTSPAETVALLIFNQSAMTQDPNLGVSREGETTPVDEDMLKPGILRKHIFSTPVRYSYLSVMTPVGEKPKGMSDFKRESRPLWLEFKWASRKKISKYLKQYPRVAKDFRRVVEADQKARAKPETPDYSVYKSEPKITVYVADKQVSLFIPLYLLNEQRVQAKRRRKAKQQRK